jgi:hypothetical protein
VTARSANTDVLEALAQLELKLTTLISAGLAQIKDDHNRALLAQAEKNATFASREVVETLRSQIDRNTGEIIALHTQERVAGEDRTKLRADLDVLTAAGPKRTIRTYDRWTGYLLSSATGILTGFLVYALTHYP